MGSAPFFVLWVSRFPSLTLFAFRLWLFLPLPPDVLPIPSVRRVPAYLLPVYAALCAWRPRTFSRLRRACLSLPAPLSRLARVFLPSPIFFYFHSLSMLACCAFFLSLAVLLSAGFGSLPLTSPPRLPASVCLLASPTGTSLALVSFRPRVIYPPRSAILLSWLFPPSPEFAFFCPRCALFPRCSSWGSPDVVFYWAPLETPSPTSSPFPSFAGVEPFCLSFRPFLTSLLFVVLVSFLSLFLPFAFVPLRARLAVFPSDFCFFTGGRRRPVAVFCCFLLSFFLFPSVALSSCCRIPPRACLWERSFL